MDRVLKGIKPECVFSYFEDLSQIPRCSGNEKQASDYLVNFANERNFEVIQDEALNVIIKKCGTEGYENAPTVILQGHIDMVCEKNNNTKHDFTCEPIKLSIHEDMIFASGTTLGADNGIAVAYCLALLDSEDIPHPPLEVVITTGEETGMEGAIKLDPNNIKGKILLNIDAEDEGTFFVSCAGGLKNRVHIPIKRKKAENDFLTCAIRIRGLKGGHSGMDINKERGNANKLLARVLNALYNSLNILLVDINGGSKSNAIPREADAKILIEGYQKEDLKNIIDQLNITLKNEFKASDSGISIEYEYLEEKIDEAYTSETTEKVIAALMLIPNGIQAMSMDIEGLVQSSTNMGVVTSSDEKVTIESAIRSSVKTLKYDIVDRIDVLAKVLNCESEKFSEYPEWEYNSESYIRRVFHSVYKEMYGEDPTIAAIHAGLECGLFKEKLGDIDMIAFGPNMYDVHTPGEHLNIPSTARTWDFLCSALKEIR